jgi:hypothetical protein
MDADFSIELGREDPVLDFPWKDPSGEFAYRDLKRHPELLSQIPEAGRFRELAEFLQTTNSIQSTVETAKCDAWTTTELTPEEEIYDAPHKFASYVDVVFSDSNIDARFSLAAHQRLVRKLMELLRPAAEIAGAAEVCVRRCYFGGDGPVRAGFYFTIYVTGYGDDIICARRHWGVALQSTGKAIAQLSSGYCV